jgi:hypothetical protein
VLGAAFDLVGERNSLISSVLMSTGLKPSNPSTQSYDEETVDSARTGLSLIEGNFGGVTYHVQVDNLIQFLVPVLAGGESVVTYTIRYHWPDKTETTNAKA